MAKLSKQQWEEISELYRTGTAMSLITQAYPVKRQTVWQRAKDKGWARDLETDVQLATGEKLTGLTSAASPEERKAAVSQLADDRASLIQMHRKGWVDIYGLDVAAMRVMRGEPTIYARDFHKHPAKTKAEDGSDLSGQPILDGAGKVQWFDPVLPPEKRVALATKLTLLMKERALALQTAQEGERRAHGFDYKTQQESEQQDRDKIRELNATIDELLDFMEALKKGHKKTDGHIATNENKAKIIDGQPLTEGSAP
jgi:hypothetical protein